MVALVRDDAEPTPVTLRAAGRSTSSDRCVFVRCDLHLEPNRYCFLSTAANWTPARNTAAPDDILIFDNGASIAVTDVPTQTIGQLLVSGNSIVTLQAGQPRL